MPELENAVPERPTLTQKRTIGGNLPKINAFEKPLERTAERSPMRMQSVYHRDGPPGNLPSGGRIPAKSVDEAKEGGSAKIVIWVVIVVALAVASYFALRNILKGPTDNTGVPEPTVVETSIDPLAALVSPNVLSDAEATNVSLSSAYSTKDQTLGVTSDGTFSIDNLSVQKYTTFTRFTFEVSALTGTAVLPVVNTTYSQTDQQITVTFTNTTTKLDIPFNKDILVDTYTIDSFDHTTGPVATSDVYVIKLNAATGYVLQTVGSDSAIIVVDVKEATPPAQTVTTSPTVLPTTTPTVGVTQTVTPTPSVASGNVLDNAYSKLAQSLSDGLTNNSADLGPTFKWTDTATEFNYRKAVILGDGGLYPNVSAQLVDSTLEVTIQNLKVKNATSSINFTNSKVVTKLDATRSGNTVKYVFTLTAPKDYRITFDQATQELLIQVKH
jgi:hypothetical protein